MAARRVRALLETELYPVVAHSWKVNLELVRGCHRNSNNLSMVIMGVVLKPMPA